MNIDDIISSLDSGGPKSYYDFETFIQELFRNHLKEQGREFIIPNEKNTFGDGFAPSGFDNFEGPTLIEIKLNLASGSYHNITEKIIAKSSSQFIETPFNTLLIITARPIQNVIMKRIEAYISSINLPFSVKIWGPDELKRIVNKNQKIVKKISNNLFSLRLASAISKSPKEWRTERRDIINKLKASYNKGQFSLFLGAGVSSSAGMPDWNTLLNSLFVTYLAKEFDNDIEIGEKDIGDLVNRLNAVDEPSALMAARYLRKGLSKSDVKAKDFILAVTSNLYKLRNEDYIIDSDLIKSIASMCLPRRTGAKVKSVVTYNFDDLLERQLKKNTIHYRCIYTDKESYDPDELPIYHVHGFLPEDRKSYEGLDDSTLVFSEEGYHQIYSDSYHWSNLVQLNSFRESNCLMVGLSMTDPNLRRLLDISSRNIEQSKHFAFMKRLSPESFCIEKDKESGEEIAAVKNKDAAEKFLISHHALNEELMKELGVTIIWYESYEEIHQIIKDVSMFEK
ncbi:SIR2 family protein [Aeromonas taiwanensis]|uniref:SIR2 family protein n=1 Tax=Aeromonas taiwanensis TaxID=633417 RepID=UPI0009DEA9A8|nr:SIR2 family protein [Aeromonas taiwanensis]